MADTEPERKFSDEMLASEGVTKKDIIKFLHENSTFEFLKEHKLNGKLNNVAKTSKKDQLITAYKHLFEQKAFRSPDEECLEDELKHAAEELKATHLHEKKQTPREKRHSHSEDKPKEPPKYTKKILKQGDKTTYPSKGDKVSCFYIGKLEDGTVFDSNVAGVGTASKKKADKGEAKPLTFKVGKGQVIRGWDESLLTMTKGEKAEVTIEPEWAYGKKGKPDAKYPHSRLTIKTLASLHHQIQDGGPCAKNDNL